MIKPASRFIWLGLAWVFLGLCASVWSDMRVLWLGSAVLVVVVSLIDLWLLLLKKPLEVKRKLPSRFALGVEEEVELTVNNPNKSTLRVSIHDGIPPHAESEVFPWEGAVEGGGFTQIIYPAKVLRRGDVSFGTTHLLTTSPLGLWQRRKQAGTAQEVKVYPNYEPVVRFALLSMSHSENQMGIVQKNRQGISREFHQLRDYHDGDQLSQIDWKATSKRLQLISREYREQRDQNIVLMIDSGRRMRTQDGDLTQFDHCLNAVLLLSFIALRQGDQVGVMSFGGTNRWLPPVKGQNGITTILNHLYDYETTANPSDFAEAAENLLVRQRRRSLVVVLTNLRSEDSTGLIPALQLMQSKHLVMLASLREKSIGETLERPVESFDEALSFTSTHLYMRDRRRVFDELENRNIPTLDEPALTLPVAITNKYLEMKRSGRL